MYYGEKKIVKAVEVRLKYAATRQRHAKADYPQYLHLPKKEAKKKEKFKAMFAEQLVLE